MPSKGTRRYILWFCALVFLGGCVGVPSAPNHAKKTSSGEDEYEGWLYRRLTGQDKSAEAQQQQPQQPQPADTARIAPVGPMVPGPSSPHGVPSSDSALEIVPTPPDLPAGPPPTIPAALPSVDNGVSIKNMQPKEEKSNFSMSSIAPDKIYENIKKATGYGPDEKLARSLKKEGDALFLDKKYKEAAKKFATAAARWPDSPLEEDSLFLKSECEFFGDRYPDAHDSIGELLTKYPNTRHLDTVMARQFAIGRYWEQKYAAKPALPIQPNVTDKERPLFDTFGYAIQAYERVRQHDPTGPLADDSLMALGSAYFRRGRFEDAAHYYNLIRKEYPNSEHQKNAHLLGLQAEMRVYQGTSYDKTPLDESEKIARQALNQFNKKLGKERERVAEAHAQIQEEKANRDYQIAQYYEGRKCFGSARMYYRSILKEYPETRMAGQAKARMEAIQNEPDEPPDRFAWFTGLFDSRK